MKKVILFLLATSLVACHSSSTETVSSDTMSVKTVDSILALSGDSATLKADTTKIDSLKKK